MLVLTRKQSESIKIGNDITITVVRIDGNKIRLGIEAPKHINVKRMELLDHTHDQADPMVEAVFGGISVDLVTVGT